MKHLPTPESYVKECLQHTSQVLRCIEERKNPFDNPLTAEDDEVAFQRHKQSVLQACLKDKDFSPTRILTDAKSIDAKNVSLFGVRPPESWQSQVRYVRALLQAFQWDGYPSSREFGT